jgi:hypothetical protein
MTTLDTNLNLAVMRLTSAKLRRAVNRFEPLTTNKLADLSRAIDTWADWIETKPTEGQ